MGVGQLGGLIGLASQLRQRAASGVCRRKPIIYALQNERRGWMDSDTKVDALRHRRDRHHFCRDRHLVHDPVSKTLDSVAL